MTSGNYQALCKILGKLSYFFDQAGAGNSSLAQAFAALYDQVAKPDSAPNNEIVIDFAGSANALNNLMTSGGASLQTQIVNATKNFLTSNLVYDYFVHSIPASQTPLAVITALIAEMTADSATMTTVPTPATGMVNLIQQISAGAAIPQTADGSATYKDSVYSVVAIQ